MPSLPQLFDQYIHAAGLPAVFSEQLFRAACARRLAEQGAFRHSESEVPVLRRIAGVGALGFRFGGPSQDDKILTRFLIDAYIAGLLIAPDFTVDCVNFTQKRDFLKETWAYDAVVVCYIIGFPVLRTLKTELKIYDPAAIAHDDQDFGHALSSAHTAKAWRARIRQSGAQIVMTYGSREEISARDLEHKYSLVEILPGPDETRRIANGFLVQPTYAKAYRARTDFPLDRRTILGQALLTAKLAGFFDPPLQVRLHLMFNRMLAVQLREAFSARSAAST